MFLFRLCSSIVLIALFLCAIFVKNEYGLIIFGVFGVVMAYAGVFEYLKCLENIKRYSYPIFTSVCAAIIVVLLMFMGISLKLVVGVALFFVLFFWIHLMVSKNDEKVLDKVVNSTSALMSVLLPLAFIPALYMIGEGSSYVGRYLVFYLVLVTKAGDMGAYAVGTSTNKLMNGNHKIIPSISPKKSWEGTIGGLLTSVIISIILWKILKFDGSIGLASLNGALLFIGGFVGDLSESSLKRICEVKDSGGVIPGIGGVLDVLDSLLINAPVFCLLYLLYNG